MIQSRVDDAHKSWVESLRRVGCSGGTGGDKKITVNYETNENEENDGGRRHRRRGFLLGSHGPGRMIEHKTQILVAPALINSSCWRSLPGGGYEARWQNPGIGEILRAALIFALSLGILVANLLVICVINSRRYHKYIHAQVIVFLLHDADTK